MFDLGKCKLVTKTDRAILIKQVDPPKCDDVGQVWVPIGCLDDDSELLTSSSVGDVGKVFVHEWFAISRKWL